MKNNQITHSCDYELIYELSLWRKNSQNTSNIIYSKDGFIFVKSYTTRNITLTSKGGGCTFLTAIAISNLLKLSAYYNRAIAPPYSPMKHYKLTDLNRDSNFLF
ncbi:hypothetical protein GCM10007916_28580 [Psychromonas marina]|uniref:Uncharacterized protein n=1 Tax=Psychromonas marina TaxID=88364 RepID=A0ABQ6E307_9GAMM|nr:hypothetical protein GCM10007916_28580 [Psychromonas marina]